VQKKRRDLLWQILKAAQFADKFILKLVDVSAIAELNFPKHNSSRKGHAKNDIRKTGFIRICAAKSMQRYDQQWR
jgi:hypothetical protein